MKPNYVIETNSQELAQANPCESAEANTRKMLADLKLNATMRECKSALSALDARSARALREGLIEIAEHLRLHSLAATLTVLEDEAEKIREQYRECKSRKT